MLFLRNDVEAKVFRLPGQLYERKAEGIISNVYSFKIVNKTTEKIDNINYKLLSHKGKIEIVTHQDFTLPKQGMAEGSLFIELHQSQLKNDRIKLKIGVYSKNKLIETTTTNFLGPRKFW